MTVCDAEKQKRGVEKRWKSVGKALVKHTKNIQKRHEKHTKKIRKTDTFRKSKSRTKE